MVHVWHERNRQLKMMADDGRTHDLSTHEAEMLKTKLKDVTMKKTEKHKRTNWKIVSICSAFDY